MPMSFRYSVCDGEIFEERRSNSTRFYRSDALGNVIALYDSNQTKTDTKSFWSYGGTRASSGNFGSLSGFMGAFGVVTQSDGGLYARARILEPDDARFTTVDPIWPEEPAYVYGKSNPITFSDPRGFQASYPGPLHGIPPDRIHYPGPVPGRWPCKIYHCKQNAGFRHEFVCTEGLGPGSDCSGGAYPGWNPCGPAVQKDKGYAGSCLSGTGPGPDEYTCRLISINCKEAAEVCKELGKPMESYYGRLFCIGYACKVRCASCRAHPPRSQARKDCVCNRCNCANRGGIKDCLDPDGVFITCGFWKP